MVKMLIWLADQREIERTISACPNYFSAPSRTIYDMHTIVNFLEPSGPIE